MLNLAATTHKLQLVTSSAADIDVVVSGADIDRTTPASPVFDVFTEPATIASATTTDICAAPATDHKKNVKHISIRNKHASTACDVTVVHDLSGTDRELFKCTLAAGEELVFNEGVWFHFDVLGGVYTGPAQPVATDTVQGVVELASQAEMEAGTDTTRAVVPGRQHFHPGHPKAWGKATVTGAVPTLDASYNITSITDTATDQLTVTINNDLSSVHYSLNVSIEAATTTLSATTTSLAVFIRFGTQAAGSFIIQACEFDVGNATDPAAWHWQICGDL